MNRGRRFSLVCATICTVLALAVFWHGPMPPPDDDVIPPQFAHGPMPPPDDDVIPPQFAHGPMPPPDDDVIPPQFA